MEAFTDPPVARMDTHKYTLDSGVVTTWLEDSHQKTKVLLSLSCMPAALLPLTAEACACVCVGACQCVYFQARESFEGQKASLGLEDSAVMTSQVPPE